MAKIYTKYGDSGYTYTKHNPKTPKNHLLVHMLGDLDELNSNLGHLHSLVCSLRSDYYIQDKIDSYDSILVFIRKNIELLFSVGAFVGYDTELKNETLKDFTKYIETTIDELEKANGALQNFVLPIGNIASTKAHICRAMCRRAERNFYDLSDKEAKADVFLDITVYLNRLSDSLFSIARALNRLDGVKEILWSGKKD